MPRGKTPDLIGHTFGRLSVMARTIGSDGHVAWVCACTCGNERVRKTRQLTSRPVQSCGCMNKENQRARLSAHGHASRDATGANCPTGTYTSWRMMRRRCQPSYKQHADYFDRGIAVCERWLVFKNFLADMGTRPTGLSLDRIDNDRGYEPGNCRWATRAEQTRNRRASRLTPEIVSDIKARHAKGESQRQIARRLGIACWNVQAVVERRAWADVP